MLRQFATASSRTARLASAAASASTNGLIAKSIASTSATSGAERRLLLAATSSRTASLHTIRGPAASLRWYSSEAGKADAEKKGAEPAEPEAAPASEAAPALSEAEVAALRESVAAKTKEASEWKDKCLRAVADFRNLQERTQREMKAARDFAITQFAKDLVDSVDNLDRALSMASVPPSSSSSEAAGETPETALGDAASKTAQDLANLIDGLKMTETVLLQTLKKHGLERFDPAGEKFNPNEHEATFMTPMPGQENNTVFHTQQKGFRLNGRVVRAAKVGVVKNP